MKFETRNINECIGWQTAHSITLGAKRIKKASIITAKDIAFMLENDVSELQVFKLDATDVPENKAAALLAEHFSGENTQTEKSTRGRCNIIAAKDGLITIPNTLKRANMIDEAITISTLSDKQPVKKGQLIATVKIIPYALGPRLLDKALDIAASITLSPFLPYKTALLTSDTALKDKALSAIENRIISTGGELTAVIKCEHAINSMSQDFAKLKNNNDTDLILVLGASAISDRRDIVPSALVNAVGKIDHIGMPVDP